MSWDFCRTTIQMASKDYRCGAAEWIDNSGMDEEDFGVVDWEIIQQARKEKFMILKGTKYIKTKGIWEGEWEVFRARIDLDEICKKYDLYVE